MEKQEKINKLLIGFSFLLTLISWNYVIYHFSNLPNKIVAHISLKGEINRFDSKWVLWFILAVFSAISLLILWFSSKRKLHHIRLKDKMKQKTATLLVLPFLAMIQFFVVFIMIHKTLNPSFNTSKILFFFSALTIVFLIIYFKFTFKNIKK